MRTLLGDEIDIDALLARMANQLAGKLNPLQIILFGSRARGDAREDSDIDLLVVVPDYKLGDGWRHRMEVCRALSAIMPLGVPYDLVVSCPREIDRLGDLPSWTLYEAVHEGVVLYDRSNTCHRGTRG